ncbi:acetylxylan esterase [Adhaeribacter radiodurans]|uniref:Acetylxylan esterase n=1 Tax=Adhaeribacter radiodurans TaxID=2745197 RepID=A0A7L7LGC9_9BACT|nr:acetylxylan esterase [Adhaeribacter radiodurans]
MALAGIPTQNLHAQETFNYDETKVGTYTLPPLLQTPDGKKITTTTQWNNIQRPALLKLFADNVYGRLPGKPKGLHFKVTSEDKEALGGKAIRKQITIYFTPADTGASMDVLLYLPKQAKGPVPIFAGLNFKGNHTVHTDPEIKITSRWVAEDKNAGITGNKANENTRGLQASRWVVEEILTRGYGLATAYYGDLEPDYPEGYKTGIRTQLSKSLQIQPNEWGAIGAWAWGMSRIMDYFETDPAINAKQVALQGHSRIGKAALWTGANDTRFAMIISNESGEGGAALARRWYGETVARLNSAFPHWFNPNYKKFNDKPNQLPVDQHQLLALIAPRPLYVASAQEDQWSDPKGEFLSAQAVGPVYALFSKKGIETPEMPGLNQPVGETVRYHNRSGKHDVTLYDWQQYLDFADKQFSNKQ